LHAAAVAHDALVLDALVLPAEALVVLLGSEDPLAEKAVLLRAVGPVVDRLGLAHLAERPVADVGRRREADAHARNLVHALVAGLHGGFSRAPVQAGKASSRWISMFRHRPLISLQSTSNDTGVPASSVFSPLTIAS